MWVCAWEYVRGLVHARVGLELCARGWSCARGAGAVRAGLELCARGWSCARGAGAVRAGPFAGGLNPLMRSWALLVAVWAACLDYHLWG